MELAALAALGTGVGFVGLLLIILIIILLLRL
jgi:hypothetical protein